MKFTALICIYNPDIDALNKTVKSIKDFDKTVEILIIDNCSDVYVPKIKGTKIFKLRKNVDYKKVKEMGVLNRKTNSRGDLYLKANIVLPQVESLDEALIKMMQEKLPQE